ncbi:hypothetical protein COCNU_scaffold001075G000010 [Cocos nucifera]|nr:hypothetical protein [Cocos nucifera]
MSPQFSKKGLLKEIDADELLHLSKGLRAYKRKGATISEPSKRVKVDIISSAAPTDAATDAPATTIATKATAPLTSMNPLAEVPTLELPTERVMEVEKKKKEKKKLAAAKVRCGAAARGSNYSDEDLGENPFNNKDIIKKLVDGCTLPEVIDRIIEAIPEQGTWNSLESFLEIDRTLVDYQYQGDEPHEIEGRES